MTGLRPSYVSGEHGNGYFVAAKGVDPQLVLDLNEELRPILKKVVAVVMKYLYVCPSGVR